MKINNPGEYLINKTKLSDEGQIQKTNFSKCFISEHKSMIVS